MNFSVKYIYELINRYSAPIRKIDKDTKRFESTVERTQRTLRRMQGRLQAAGSSMANFRTAVGAAGAGLALKGLLSTAVDFEAALNQVEAVTQATTGQMVLLRKQAKDLGRTTQFSASQAAGAMNFLGMAGLKTNQILEVMPGMLDLAAAGNLQLADAADISTNILAAYQLPLSQIGHLSDVLAFSAANANTNVYEMAGAMRNVAATANLAGVGVEETASMLMILANAGIKGEEAGTQVMNAIRALTAMAPKTQKALGKLKINPKTLLDSQGKIKDLTGIIDQLGKRGATLGELFKIFDIRGAKAMAVLKASGGKALRTFTKQLENADGTAQRMAKTLMKGAPGAIKRFKSVWESVVLFMASTILPTFTKLVERISGFLETLERTNPGLLKFATMGLIASVAIGAIMVPLGVLLSGLGALSGMLAGIAGPITLVVAGVAALAAAFVYWYQQGHPVIDTLKEISSVISDSVLSIISELAYGFGFAGDKGEFLKSSMHFLGNAIGVIVSQIAIAIQGLSFFAKRLLGIANIVGKIITLDFSGAKAAGIRMFADAEKDAKRLYATMERGNEHFKGLLGIGAYSYEAQQALKQDVGNLKLAGARSAGMAPTLNAPLPLTAPLQQLKDANISKTMTQKSLLEGAITVKAEPGSRITKTEMNTTGLGNNLSFAPAGG
jgi:TP901 family phage tail tape measure protein